MGMLRKYTILVIFLAVNQIAFSAPGDTTRVRTHDKTVIRTNPAVGFTRYAAFGRFPAQENGIRKLYLDLTFECAPGQKCGEWDYINRILLGKRRGRNNDSLGWEISRFITPYGFYWDASQNWSFKWRIDLSDFASLFSDSIEIIYEHTGYESNTDRGWRITLDFTAIEGPPIRPVTRMHRLIQTNAPYGNDSLFRARVPDMAFQVESGTKALQISVIQTGHGMDQTENCAEFCAKKRAIALNGDTLSQGYVWNNECGSNPLFPQAGTWLYDRAGWCPGAAVRMHQVFVENPIPGRNTLQLLMESYTASRGGGGNYSITVYVRELGDFHAENDATISDILAPSREKEYGRINPICGEPVISIQNMGKKPLTGLRIAYGTRGNAKATYNWTGNLPSGARDTISLPRFFDWGSNPGIFEVNIDEPNGVRDAYMADNQAWSQISYPTVYPDKLIIRFFSNNAPTENSWQILDANNHVIYERRNFTQKQTLYLDTVQLYNGCFTFLFDDSGEPPAEFPLNRDGLNWWANTHDGAGSIQLRNGNTGGLVQNFNADFGTFIRRSFTVGFPLQNTEVTSQALRIFPNPAGDYLYIETDRPAGESYQITDYSGRMVQRGIVTPQSKIQVKNLSSGAYIFTLHTPSGILRQRFIKQ
jgi:hypothetical protein